MFSRTGPTGRTSRGLRQVAQLGETQLVSARRLTERERAENVARAQWLAAPAAAGHGHGGGGLGGRQAAGRGGAVGWRLRARAD